MSVFSGKAGKGAMRAHRDRKRADAQARDAALSPTSPRRRDIRRTLDRLEEGLNPRKDPTP